MEQDDQDWQRGWDRLREQALAQVRRGFPPPLGRGRHTERLLRIVYLPSFEDAVGWELFEVGGGNAPASCLAHRSTWRQERDLQEFGGPQDRLTLLRRRFLGNAEPTMAYRAVTPDLGLVRAAAERLSAVTVPLRGLFSKRLGLDGDSYELTLGSFWAGITLNWWEEAPAEWGEAGAVTRELLKHLEELATSSESGEQGPGLEPNESAGRAEA